MFKFIFEILIDPLGLPIVWQYEYIILSIIAIIAYKISFALVGFLYDTDCISGSTTGSFLHWTFRTIIFFALWAVAYVAIQAVNFLCGNWLVALIGGVCVISTIIICVLAMTFYKKLKVKR